MAKFAGSDKLNNNGYSILEEGTYEVVVEDAEFNEIACRAKFVFRLQNGRKHFETLFFTKSNGDVNQVPVDTAIRIVRACLQDDSIKFFDSDDLPKIIGKYLVIEIQHNEWNGETRARLNPFNFESCEGWDAPQLDLDL